MTKDEDITLRHVVNHMSNGFMRVEARMEKMEQKINNLEQSVNQLNTKIDDVHTDLSEQINQVNNSLNEDLMATTDIAVDNRSRIKVLEAKFAA